ncbi:4156_t:CDS:2 [Funneliformis geosporum]|uniref:4156_t:CDS:1 n=1 Tax=Funneliformis geosporum TaxID=1117311 RepID=A0A9W4SNA2_9GLOM|nr:4156_t:CDS:2 [Funneliformis geosporum]
MSQPFTESAPRFKILPAYQFHYVVESHGEGLGFPELLSQLNEENIELVLIPPLVKDLILQLWQINESTLAELVESEYLVPKYAIRQNNSHDCGVAVIEIAVAKRERNEWRRSGEALELLTSLPDNSTNLVFLDPQYEPVNNVLKLDYPLYSQSDYQILSILEQVARILKPSGSWLRSQAEFAFLIQKHPTNSKLFKNRSLGNVWEENSLPTNQRNHPHQKPRELIRTLIEATTQKGDLIVDPCAGSFVVLEVCQELEREFIGVDLTYNQRKKLPPIHPGEILREELLKPYCLTSLKLAQSIKVDQQKIQAVIEEKGNIDADLSYRLGLYFGFREDYWLDLQKHYELDQEVENLANRYPSPQYPLSVNKLAPRKLLLVAQARNLRELSNYPANRLEKLREQRNYILKESSKLYREEQEYKRKQLLWYQEEAGFTQPSHQKIKKRQKITKLEDVEKLTHELYQASPRRLRDRHMTVTNKPSKGIDFQEIFEKKYKKNPFSETKKHYLKAFQEFLGRQHSDGEKLSDEELKPFLDKKGDFK